MKQRMKIAAVALSCRMLAGCGRLVSSSEYLNTSMSPALTPQVAVAPVVPPPAGETYPVIPRRGLVLPDLHEDDVSEPGPQARHDGESAPFAPSQFAQSVKRNLQNLDDALMRLNAMACQKGSAGLAAMDPKVRSFRTSAKLINEYLQQFNDSDASEWSALKVKINSELRSAAAAVWEAMQVLQRLRDPGHLFCEYQADPLLFD